MSLEAVAHGFPATGSFSDSSLKGILMLEFVFGSVALLFLYFRRYFLQKLLSAPNGSGCLADALLVAQVFPRSQYEARPIVQIVANAKPSFALVITASMFNGFYEETFLLGYLVRGFAYSLRWASVSLSALSTTSTKGLPVPFQCSYLV
jgi:hypothetical protein